MNTEEFNRKTKEAFRELNEKLTRKDLNLTVICAGGFVLSQYGLRTTKDVDGFYRSSYMVEEAIREVGNKLNLNTEEELWLKNSVQNLNRFPDEDQYEVLYEFSNLKVLMVSLKYIAGMKLKSGREKDLQDVAIIVKQLSADDPLDFLDELEKMGFGSIDSSLSLEAFGIAYGMDWLQNYFREHERDIIERL